jgi:hypothetical protein
VPSRHLATPASTDYWINDRSGDPLLVMTGVVDAALTQALPRVLRKEREVVGDRRVTIVFDRGGWSPKLFATMIKDGFDVLIYRRGQCRRINERRFIRRRAEFDGRWVDYLLHDPPVRLLKGKLRLRQVTRLCDSGHQTNVITSRWDLHDIEVAYRMFECLRQENLFKYMRKEFLPDALVDYEIEPEDPTRTIPNPERRALDKEIRAARADLAKLEREYGAAAADNADRRCAALRSLTANSEGSCTRPVFAWRAPFRSCRRALGACGARPHDVCCPDHDETWVRATIPAKRAQEFSDALGVSPPHDLRPERRVARGLRLSWQHLEPGVEPEDTSRRRADFAVGDDAQHHGASGGARPRYNYQITRCADDLVLVQELVDVSARVTSDDDGGVGMCRKKKSPREEADQFLHVCPVPLEAAVVRFVRGDFGEVKEMRRRAAGDTSSNVGKNARWPSTRDTAPHVAE